MLVNTWKFPFVELARGRFHMGHLRFFCLHRIICLNIPTVTQAYLTHSLKSSLLLAFCFLFVCTVDQTQMYPSSISPLGLFQRIICNTERLKGGDLGALNYWKALNLLNLREDIYIYLYIYIYIYIYKI